MTDPAPSHQLSGPGPILDSPTTIPKADAFLWNPSMMIQVTCRGYATAQFMQPEPAKYAHVPTLAGTSFMQPESPYFTHHPGRFFYVRDDESCSFFSAPYEPTRQPLDRFAFQPNPSDIRWLAEKEGIRLELTLSLTASSVVELWQVTMTNLSDRTRRLSLIPYFPIGYSSWMNMQAEYDGDLNAIVASCVAPYQKVEEYFKRRDWKDLTYLASDREPESWEANQAAFEGEGGLHSPDALRQTSLACGDARYEIPAAIMRYPFELEAGKSVSLSLIFGPAKSRTEIAHLKQQFLPPSGFEAARTAYASYVAEGQSVLQIETPDREFDAFVNTWLGRQVYYHGDTNRLTTDPQTRNYLQDGMGMAYIRPETTREVLCRALSQQAASGEMPDGILIHPDAQLKYINQIPHVDHGVWIIICLQAYLNETGESTFLDERLPFNEGDSEASVFEHVSRALDWLIEARDERGLSYIAQGDWCDPMNMVGYRGKGVSAWLTEALAYALILWEPLCRQRGDTSRANRAAELGSQLREAINTHFWDGNWYGRGITDDDVLFGISTDSEGRIFLNPQSWALLSGAPSPEQETKLLAAVEEQLHTPYGVMLAAPAYTSMREDVGRVTQKFPGSGENGSCYSHAAAFYAAALYHRGYADRAYQVLRLMIPGPDLEDLRQRGQLPAYIPNYYRGAYHQFPRTAGRSSHLFNTGSCSWFLRMVVEELFGLKGEVDGLRIAPKLPADWATAKAVRQFRGATFEVTIERHDPAGSQPVISVNGNQLNGNLIREITAGRRYQVEVRI